MRIRVSVFGIVQMLVEKGRRKEGGVPRLQVNFVASNRGSA
jgi:hypothetical protein